jgi:plasmid maintenance system killer protein
MLIGYVNKKIEGICTSKGKARKVLPDDEHINHLFHRLSLLAAYSTLAEIPIHSSPLHLHPLKGDRKGSWAVFIKSKWRVCFRPAGECRYKPDGSVVPQTVTEIEIVEVVDYHDD